MNIIPVLKNTHSYISFFHLSPLRFLQDCGLHVMWDPRDVDADIEGILGVLGRPTSLIALERVPGEGQEDLRMPPNASVVPYRTCSAYLIVASSVSWS